MNPEPQPPSVETDVSRPAAEMIVGTLIAVPTLPLLWVFTARLMHPDTSPDPPGATLVQLLIALAFPAFGLALATRRHRIRVDLAARTVTWTRRVYGWCWSVTTWWTSDIEAVELVESSSVRSSARSMSFYLVGPRGRLPLREVSFDSEDCVAAQQLARRLHVPFRDPRQRRPEPVGKETTGRFLTGLLLVAVGVPALFHLAFPDGGIRFAIPLTAFLLLAVVLLRCLDRVQPTPDPTAAPYVPRRFDFLGIVWLLSIPFAPLLGWIATEQLTAGNWRLMAGSRAFSCIVVPLVCVLPLLRFVRGRHALAAGIVLAVGTAFPVLTALQSAQDFLDGPVWQDVEVLDAHLPGQATRGQAATSDLASEVTLADGRSLRTVRSAPVHRGAMRLLVLPGLGRILDSEER